MLAPAENNHLGLTVQDESTCPILQAGRTKEIGREFCPAVSVRDPDDSRFRQNVLSM